MELNLTVCVRSAHGLPEVDWCPGIDRFLYVGVGEDVGGEELFKTQPKKNAVDPVWNEECQLPAGIPLVFSVLQADADGNTEVVACGSLDLAAVGADGFNGEMPLQADGMLPGGVLLLKAKVGDEYPAGQDSEFVVRVNNAQREALGLEVDSIDPDKLFVNNVKKGVILDKYDGGEPQNTVEAGQFITAVAMAGVGAVGCLAGSRCKEGSKSASGSKAMLKLLKQNPKQVDLVCRRAIKFRIALDLTATQSLGAQVPRCQIGSSLVITKVEASGPLEAWNADHPDQAVEPWDRIIEVDGKAGTVRDLERHIKSPEHSPRVMLTIIRMVADGESKGLQRETSSDFDDGEPKIEN